MHPPHRKTLTGLGSINLIMQNTIISYRGVFLLILRYYLRMQDFYLEYFYSVVSILLLQ